MSRQADLADAMRMLVFQLDDDTCQWCRKRGWGLAVDHVVPLAHGGYDHLSNYQSLCQRCNSIKGARLPAEYPDWVPESVRRYAVELCDSHLGYHSIADRPTKCPHGVTLYQNCEACPF